MIGRFARHLFGRDVGRRPYEHARHRQGAVTRARDAEVGDERATRFGVEQHVVRLYIAVNDAALVRVSERARDFGDDAPRVLDRHCALAREPIGHGAAVHARHGEIEHPVLLADEVQRHDVRM